MENNPTDKAEREKAYVELARELERGGETFKFPEIEQAAYDEIKTSESEMPNYSDFAAPIDELLGTEENPGGKFGKGMKIVGGKNPRCIVFNVVPAVDGDPMMDSILVEHLQVVPGMDPNLARLIEMSKNLK